MFAILAQSLAYDVPACLSLIQKLLINCVDLFLPEDCENLIPILRNFLNIDGNLSFALTLTLLSSGSESTELAANVLGSNIPEQYVGDRDNLDILKILLQLACGGVRVIYPEYINSRNIKQLIDRSCPPAEDQPGFMPVVKSIVCGIADEVECEQLTTEIKDMCNTS